MLAEEGGRGKGSRAQTQARGMCFHLCVQPPLTTPSSATAGASPRPLPSTPLLLLMLIACNVGHLALWGTPAQRGGLTGWSRGAFCASTRQNILQARVKTLCKHASEHCGPRPSCARLCRQHATTDKLGTTPHARGAERGTAQQLRIGSTLPECIIWQAATTGEFPTDFSFQASLPYDTLPCFHTHLIISGTAQLPEAEYKPHAYPHARLQGGMQLRRKAQQGLLPSNPPGTKPGEALTATNHRCVHVSGRGRAQVGVRGGRVKEDAAELGASTRAGRWRLWWAVLRLGVTYSWQRVYITHHKLFPMEKESRTESDSHQPSLVQPVAQPNGTHVHACAHALTARPLYGVAQDGHGDAAAAATALIQPAGRAWMGPACRCAAVGGGRCVIPH